MAQDRTPYPPAFFAGREDEHRRFLASAASAALRGHTNNAFMVSLAPEATQTVIETDLATPGGCALFHAANPGAAAAVAAGQEIWTEVQRGRVVVHHPEAPGEVRTFGVVVVG